MKSYSLIFIFNIISFYMYSQSGHYGGNNQDISKICTILQSNKFSSKSSADGALEKILSVTGMSKNFALYPCSDIENCAAVTYNGDRYILYDYKFMNIIKNNTNSWSNLSILAHEIGHHVNGHSLDLLLYAAGKKDDQTLEKKAIKIEESKWENYEGEMKYITNKYDSLGNLVSKRVADESFRFKELRE